MNEDRPRATRPTLRLVVSPQLEAVVRNTSSTSTVAVQQALFPLGVDALAVFVATNELRDEEFARLLDAVQPTYAVDLRSIPRFDIGRLTRQRAFFEFDRRNIRYVDLSPTVRSQPHSAPDFAEALAATAHAELKGRGFLTGPILLLSNSEVSKSTLPFTFLQALSAHAEAPWDLTFYPPAVTSIEAHGSVSSAPRREVIFVSHANPEENEFASWLHSKLLKLGFDVWTDVHSLGAGERFWDVIEDVIRHRAIRVIAVLSRTAQTKQGCLDEINLAIGVERSLGKDNFVLPIRVDDLPYGEVRANLARKKVIDFSSGWARGLHQLVATLQRDRVPQRPEAGPAQLLDLWTQQAFASSALIARPEKLMSTWLAIERLPSKTYVYQLNGQEALDSPMVAFSYQDTLISWTAPNEAMAAQLRLRGEIPTADFLSGNPQGLIRVPSGVASNAASNLIRHYWDRHMDRRGLRFHSLAGARGCRFFPSSTDSVALVREGERAKRRSLTGRSNKRKVNWHLGIECTVSLATPRRIGLIQHVVFTDFENREIENPKLAHRLRRGFCKGWWNDRWRDLLLAALTRISDSAGGIPLIAQDDDLVISARPMEFASPISIREAANDESEASESELDESSLSEELDSGEEEDVFLEEPAET